MAGRQFSVSFNITGALDGSLMAALKNAANAMRGLGNSARATSAAAKASQSGLQGLASSLNSIQAAAAKFRELKKALQDTKTALSATQGNASQLAAKYRQDAAEAARLRSELSKLNTQLNSAKTAKLSEQAGLKNLRQQMQELKRAYDLAKSLGNTAQMGSLSTQMTTLGAAIQAQQAKVKAAAQAYKELADKVKQAKADLKAAEQTAAASGKGFTQAKNDAARLKTSYQQQLAALQQLRSQLSAAGFNTSSFAASEARLESEINRVNAALQRQQALLNAQQRSQQASQDMFNAYGNFQNALQTAQTIAAPFKAAIDNAITFEHAMSRVKALTQSQNIREGKMDVVEADMALLTQQARDLGATTMFTATQAAEAMGYLGMAGWKTQQIYGTMPGMLNLAAAAGADLAQTADIVSDNMTAMGVPVEQAPHFMDVYAYALTNSNARLSDFGETMKYAAPVAKAFGSSLDETAAMVMMMANAGIKGSMAGTSLRMGLLRLAGPPKTATREMEKLGLSLSDAQAGALEAEAVIKGLGIDLEGATTAGDKMTRVLMQLHDKTKNLSQDEKLAAFKGIFGVNAETGWLALFDQGPEIFMKYVEGLRNADGYSQQVAKTMNDDTRGAIIVLESAWDALTERIGESLTPAVRAAAESLAPMVSAAAQWVEEHQGVVQAAAGIAAALSGVVVAAAAVKLAFAGWTFITAQIALVQTALASLGSGALLGGLIGRLAALRTAMFGLGGAATLGGWGAMFSMIAAQAAAARVAVAGFFASLSVSSVAAGAASALKMVGAAIAGAARAAFAFAFSPVGVALMALALAGLYCYQNWDRVSGVLSNIAGIITGALSGALATIAPAIQNVMTAFENLGNALSSNGILSGLGQIITGVLLSVATAIAGAVSTVINVVASIVSTVANMLAGIVNTIANVLNGDWSAAWESAKSIAVSALEGIGNVAKSIFEGITSTVQAIGDVWSMLKGQAPSTQEHGGGGGDIGAPQAAAPAPEVPTLDTSATQASLDAVGDAAQNAATNMDGVRQAGDALSQLLAAVTPVQTSFTTLDTQAQTAGTNIQTIATNAQSAGTNIQTLGTNAQSAGTNVQTLGTNSQTAGVAMSEVPGHAANLNAGLELPIGNLSALGTAAGGAVDGVSALGSAAGAAASALRAKASEIAAIHIQAPTVSAAPAAANAEGGIYRKGAFLTTFAEESPEAAIPIENTKRSKNLWTRVGQMLGFLPKDKKEKSIEPTPPPKEALNAAKSSNILSRKEPLPIPPAPDTGKDESGKPKKKSWYEKFTDVIKSLPDDGRRLPHVNRRSRNPRVPFLIKRQPPRRESDMPRNLPRAGIPHGIGLPRLPFPVMTPPTFPKLDEPKEQGGGLIERPKVAPRSEGDAALSTINLTVNVTVNGNADEATIKRGVESAAPAIEKSLAAQLREHRREQMRRSYA